LFAIGIGIYKYRDIGLVFVPVLPSIVRFVHHCIAIFAI